MTTYDPFRKLSKKLRTAAQAILRSKAEQFKIEDLEPLKKELNARLKESAPKEEFIHRMFRRVELLTWLLFGTEPSLEESEWKLVGASLAYYIEEHDLIDDSIPHEGLVDDAYVISLALNEVKEKALLLIRAKGLREADYF